MGDEAWVAWFVGRVVLADEEGGVRITIHEWLAAVYRFRSSRAGARAAREALENSLRLGGVRRSWADALVEVLRGDAFLAGWEGTPDFGQDRRPMRKALRTLLWDVGVLQLGGREDYPQWVPGGAESEGRFRLGGVPLHPGTTGGFPCPVNLLPGESQHRVNKPMVRKMGALGAGRPTGWTEQHSWLLEVLRAKTLGRDEAASLWAEWEIAFSDFLDVHGCPHQHRSRVLAINGEMPHKVYERRIRGGLESAVADPTLRGKGLGGVRFVRSDELRGRVALRNEQILRYWAEDLWMLDQSVHVSECPLPGTFAKFGQGGFNWPIADPKITARELRQAHGWPLTLEGNPQRAPHVEAGLDGAEEKGESVLGQTAPGQAPKVEAAPADREVVEGGSPGRAEVSDGEQGWRTGDEGGKTPRSGPSGHTPGRG
jgi:hypothetical protein